MTSASPLIDVSDPTPADVRLMRAELASEWWTIALRGAIAIIFGLVALFWPGGTLGVLALLFGVFALADGLFAAAAAIRIGRLGKRWWPMALEGLAGIVVGLIAIIWPTMAALTLVAFIGAWALITGVMEIVAAMRLRREIENEWLLGLAGVLSVLFGLFAVASPVLSAIALVWVVGAYAIAFGATLVALGLKLRTWQPPSLTSATATTATTSTTSTTSTSATQPIDVDGRYAERPAEADTTQRAA